MKNYIAIVAGEPNSINSEIIVKALKKTNRKKHFFIIGNFSIFKKQIDKIGLKFKISKITSIKDLENIKNFGVLDVPLNFGSIFEKNSNLTKNYVLKCLDIAHNLAVNKKIKGFINAPVEKKIFNNKYLGVTEYLGKKNKTNSKEVMLIHNKMLSVLPLTTHLEIKNVTNKIKPDLIKKKLITLNKFYYKFWKAKPQIIVLGLNPHNSENRRNSIENRIIKPSIKYLKRLGLNIEGPFPADTAFIKNKKKIHTVIVGMYHDQVLAPFKALYKYNAINITLGLKYMRVSPDHGVARDIAGLNRANAQSMISSINFLNKIND